MSTLITGSIRVDKLPKEKFVKGKDVAFMEPQTKEERDAKVAKNYLGNGKVVWTDGNVKLAEREEEAAKVEATADSDLPF